MAQVGMVINNPVNIRYVALAARFHGEIAGEEKTTEQWCEFESLAYGLRAGIIILGTYDREGHTSVMDKISRYAPPEDHNNTIGYAQAVAQALGIGINDHLDPHNLGQLALLLPAWVKIESGPGAASHVTPELIHEAIQLSL